LATARIDQTLTRDGAWGQSGIRRNRAERNEGRQQ
jgi:hypothetical protein